ncbi:hypothetical protein [Streptomyces toxytricini]|uniref:hypothetical protein n=1 Tax=Streptomyces toxytricini TaxID=67369 RepID=UPI00343C1844
MTTDEKTGSGAAGLSDSERLLFGGALAYDIGWDRHEGAWLSLGLWSTARQLPRLVGTGLRLAHPADPRALRVVLPQAAAFEASLPSPSTGTHDALGSTR